MFCGDVELARHFGVNAVHRTQCTMCGVDPNGSGVDPNGSDPNVSRRGVKKLCEKCWRCKLSRASFPLGVPRAAVPGGLEAAYAKSALARRVPRTISPLVSGPLRDGKGHAASGKSSPTSTFLTCSRHAPCRRSAGPAPRCGDVLFSVSLRPGPTDGTKGNYVMGASPDGRLIPHG